MDIVFIEALQVDAIIGIYDWERTQRQPIVLDLELASDISAAAKSDRIDDALDYEAICNRLSQFIEDSRFELVETLAEACASILIQEFHIPWLRLKLSKPKAIKNTRAVGIVIERGRLENNGTPNSTPYSPTKVAP